MELKDKKCVPCEGGLPKLSPDMAQGMLAHVQGWQLQGDKIYKSYTFKNFLQAMRFVNQMADTAEAEGHHPNFCVNYNVVEVTIWTHAINGLSENDFILASKLDAIAQP